jgi:RNA polymerase sigma factor (sigma-70 family)
MRDREIVAAIVAGDPAGLAAAYDSYAAVLHGYCRSLLHEPADAADAVQDTFVIAAAKLEGLRDPDRLRPWLYAVARNECHRRLRGRARLASLEEAGDMSEPAADEPAAAADRAGLRELVTAALTGLNTGDREVIELSLRHDLNGSDLADALGVPLNQAHALASRARAQLERSLGALLVARTGRRSCAELDTILGRWDGQFTALMRKRVSRHIENCEICGERKRRELSPAMLFSVLPLVTLPGGLRRQVLRLVSDSWPEAVSYRDQVVRRAGEFTESGFPVPLDVPVLPAEPEADAERKRRIRPNATAYAAAAALLLLGGGGGTA